MKLAMEIRATLALALALVAASPSFGFGTGKSSDDVRPPDRGALTLTSSARVASGEWLRPASESSDRPAVLIADDLHDATLDLRGAEWRGLASGMSRDRSAGVGLLVRRCSKLKVLGGRFSGYRVCVRVEDSSDVQFEGTSAQDFYSEPLASTSAVRADADDLERANPATLERTGAGFALLRSTNVSLSSCSASRGSLGLALVDSSAARVVDGRFRFLSAFGVAIWKSPDAWVSRCAIEFCARGSTGGDWTGGQGSAGVLIVDSPRVRVGECSIARCGSSIAVLGASERASIVRNDCSWSVGDALEIRSSDVDVFENVARWSGGNAALLIDASRVHVFENQFEFARASAVTISSGVQIALCANFVHACARGLEARATGELVLMRDAFVANDTDWALENVRALSVEDEVFDVDGHELAITGDPNDAELSRAKDRIRGIGGTLPSGRMIASNALEMDPERRASLESDARLVVREFPGKTSPRCETAKLAGAELVIGRLGPWDFEAKEPRPADRPRGGLFADASWNARWFRWDEESDPRSGSAVKWRALADQPLVAGEIGVWTSPCGSASRAEAVGADHFGLIATARMTLEAGRYRVSATSDDGVRLLVDKRQVLENWTWHGVTIDRAEFQVAAGEHEFTLEYFQVDGASALTLELDRIAP